MTPREYSWSGVCVSVWRRTADLDNSKDSKEVFVYFCSITEYFSAQEKETLRAAFRSHVTKNNNKQPLPAALCGFEEEDFEVTL